MFHKSICVAFLLSLALAPPILAQSKPYRGAELRTKIPYKYGRFEVRMKSTFGSGMLTSFFTYHDNDPDPIGNWNEIDIEIMGRYTNEVQFNTITHGQVNHVFHNETSFNPHRAFHIYAIEWTPDYVAWQIDGYEVHRQTGAHIETLSLAQKIMMNIWQPIYVDWAGAFDPNILPVYGYYDWVKFYEYTPGEGDNFTLMWVDNFNSWDLLRWDKATHTWSGNNALFTPDNVVFQDGYMILCLTMPGATGYHGGAVVDDDVDPPYWVRARAQAASVQVYFSEAVEPLTAETAANYIIPGITVKQATLLPSNQAVELVTDSLDLAQSYLILVSGVKDRAPEPNVMALQSGFIAHSLSLPVSINVGGASEENLLADQIWEAPLEYGGVGGQSKLASTTIDGADNSPAYQSQLEGLTFYNIRLPAGTYNVKLLLAEFDNSTPAARVFEIYAENQLVADNVDVHTLAGNHTAYAITLQDLAVTDGVLNLYFKAQAGEPILNGVCIEAATATHVADAAPLPDDFSLSVFPNPFNPQTTIAYRLPFGGRVDLAVFNSRGQLVRRLLDGRRAAGSHAFKFHADGLSTGAYFVMLNVDGRHVRSTKLLYLK